MRRHSTCWHWSLQSRRKATKVTSKRRTGLTQDVALSEIPPRWPPSLPSGTFANPTFEVTSVDATSISFVVNRILKVSPLNDLGADTQADSIGIVDKKSAEAREKVMHGVAEIYEEVSSLPSLPEVEWDRLRAMEFQDLLRQRTSLMDRLEKLQCTKCPDFDDHVSVSKVQV